MNFESVVSYPFHLMFPMQMIPSIFSTTDMMTLLAVSKQYQDVVIQEMSFEPVITGKLSIPLNVEMFPATYSKYFFNHGYII